MIPPAPLAIHFVQDLSVDEILYQATISNQHAKAAARRHDCRMETLHYRDKYAFIEPLIACRSRQIRYNGSSVSAKNDSLKITGLTLVFSNGTTRGIHLVVDKQTDRWIEDMLRPQAWRRRSA